MGRLQSDLRWKTKMLFLRIREFLVRHPLVIGLTLLLAVSLLVLGVSSGMGIGIGRRGRCDICRERDDVVIAVELKDGRRERWCSFCRARHCQRCGAMLPYGGLCDSCLSETVENQPLCDRCAIQRSSIQVTLKTGRENWCEDCAARLCSLCGEPWEGNICDDCIQKRMLE